MRLPKVPIADLEKIIQRRAVEISVGEGDAIAIPSPSVVRLREPTGICQVHWTLADFQNSQGVGYIKVAAAEMSATYDVEGE